MILESAMLHIRSGKEADFEAAMADAAQFIRQVPGFKGLEVRRGIERPGSYLLLVRWASLEAHSIGFRQSPHYREWRARLHGFYEPFPLVEHWAEPAVSAEA
ncbi:antibiotic biosynthesis monooxygenase family protein [Ferrovibrio sp.]|uniref:antibiotic biosynthesis monooxygenase family protein n=1 Tax=Ferrovibrio sp. TaxID=1917215 RepID=UPI003D0CFD1E